MKRDSRAPPKPSSDFELSEFDGLARIVSTGEARTFDRPSNRGCFTTTRERSLSSDVRCLYYRYMLEEILISANFSGTPKPTKARNVSQYIRCLNIKF